MDIPTFEDWLARRFPPPALPYTFDCPLHGEVRQARPDECAECERARSLVSMRRIRGSITREQELAWRAEAKAARIEAARLDRDAARLVAKIAKLAKDMA